MQMSTNTVNSELVQYLTLIGMMGHNYQGIKISLQLNIRLTSDQSINSSLSISVQEGKTQSALFALEQSS